MRVAIIGYGFVDIIATDERIGHSHMKVPGIDGKFGFGGPCFPKDCNANGWMAEWLCSGLQSRLRRFDSGFSLQIIGVFFRAKYNIISELSN